MIIFNSAVSLSSVIRWSLFIPPGHVVNMALIAGSRRVSSATFLLFTSSCVIFASPFHCRKCFKSPADLVSIGLVELDNVIHECTYPDPGELHYVAVS